MDNHRLIKNYLLLILTMTMCLFLLLKSAWANDGNGWSSFNTGLMGGNVQAIVLETINPTDSDTIFIGTFGGGFYYSIYNFLNSEITWHRHNDGLDCWNILSLLVKKNGNTKKIYAGTTDGIYILESLDQSWSAYDTTALKSVTLLKDCEDPNYSSAFYAGRGKYDLENPPKGLYIFEKNFIPAFVPFGSDSLGNSYNPKVFDLIPFKNIGDKQNVNTFMVATDLGFFRFLDSQKLTDKPGLKLPSVEILSLSEIPLDDNSYIIYAGTPTGGKISYTQGNTWWDGDSFLANKKIPVIEPSFSEKKITCYAATDPSKVCRSSSDDEQKWIIPENKLLPNLDVHSLAINSNNSQHLFSGNNLGVYFSDCQAESWQVKKNGLEAVRVHDLFYDETRKYIWAATDGSLYKNKLMNATTSWLGENLFMHITTIALDSKNDILYVGTKGQYVHFKKPIDSEGSWVQFAAKDILDSNITIIKIDSLSNLWIGTETKGIFKYRTNQQQWSQIPIDGLEGAHITDIVFDTQQSNISYTSTLNNGVYKINSASNDFLFWDKDAVYSIASIDLCDSIFAGTQDGIWVFNKSMDFTSSWRPYNLLLNDNLQNVYELKIIPTQDPFHGVLYALACDSTKPLNKSTTIYRNIIGVPNLIDSTDELKFPEYQIGKSFCVNQDNPNVVYLGTGGTGVCKYEFEPQFSVQIDSVPINFGDVHKDGVAEKIIQITNKNLLMPLIVSDSLNNITDFYSSLSDSILYPGIAETGTIRFNPKSSKDFKDILYLRFRDIFIHPQLDTVIKLNLTGRGCEGILHAYPNPIDFGKVPQFTERVDTLFLENQGNIQLRVETIKLAVEDKIFRLIDSVSPPIVIQPNTTSFIRVGFRPQLNNDWTYRNSLIILYHDYLQDQNQETLVDLLGIGVLNPIKPTPPDTIDFKDIHIKHLPSKTEFLKIENECDYLSVWIDRLIHRNKIFLVDTSEIPKELRGEDSISVKISVDTTSKIDLYLDSLSIYFKYFYNDSIFGNPDVILRANIVSGIPRVEPLEWITDRKAHVNYDFYDSAEIKLHNNGNILMHYRIDSIRSPFVLVSSDTGSIPKDDSVKIKIKFCPKDIRPDTCVMKINFWDLEDRSGMNAIIHDSLIGIGADVILEFIEDITNCKDTHIKGTDLFFVKLTNIGNIPVLIDKVESNNSVFSIVTFPDTIKPGIIDSIKINFSPQYPQQYISKLTVTYSDSFLRKIHTLKIDSCSISGLGVGSRLEVYDTTNSQKIEVLDFGHAHWGNDFADSTVILKNVGNLDLVVIEPKLPHGFSQVNNIDTLKEGESLLLTLKFIPYKVNEHMDSVQFVYSDFFDGKLYPDSTILKLKGFGDGAWLTLDDSNKVNFGEVLVKTDGALDVKIENIGNITCKIDLIKINNACFTAILLSDSILAGGETCSLQLIFSPKKWITESGLGTFYYYEIDNSFIPPFFPTFELCGTGTDTVLPQIWGTDYTHFVLKHPASVSAKVIDEHSGLDTSKVWLKIRKGGKIDFDSLKFAEFNQKDSTFTWNISGNWVTLRGVEFYFEAVDSTKKRAQFPDPKITNFDYISPPVRIPEEIKGEDHEGKIVTLKTGNAQKDYQLISIPVSIDIGKRSVSNILKKSLHFQDYDEYYWRCADYYYLEEADTSFFIYLNEPRFSEFNPGKSFFLILHEGLPYKNILCPSGYTIRTDTIYDKILLKKGWNLIANPFNFPIPIENLFDSDSNGINLLAFEEDWIAENDTIYPWKGYAISTESAKSLFIDPDLSHQHLTNSLTTANENSGYQWSIFIEAFCQNSSNKYNIAAISEMASIEYDQFDLPEPPLMGEYIMLSFPHPEWKKACDFFTIDVQPPSAEGNFWDFSVYTNIPNSEVKLNFKNLESVPENFQIILISENLKYIQDLRQKNQFIYNSTTGQQGHKFRLAVGNPDFVADNNLKVDFIPEELKVNANFPNPFNSATNIRYDLPQNDLITIQVYNVLGELIKTLKKEDKQSAGKYFVVWDGTNDNGRPVGSGLYFCKFISNHYAKTIKMLLIR